MKEEPLIWTKTGNRKIADLKVEAEWEVEPDKWVKLTERYFDRETNQVVRESTHVLSLRGMDSQAQTKGLN